MIAAQIGRQISGSVANEMRLSLKSAKPALLNGRHRVEHAQPEGVAEGLAVAEPEAPGEHRRDHGLGDQRDDRHA